MVFHSAVYMWINFATAVDVTQADTHLHKKKLQSDTENKPFGITTHIAHVLSQFERYATKHACI